MFKNTPFEAIAKTLSEASAGANPAAVQEALQPVQDSLKALADLAQAQAQEAQAMLTQAVESIKEAKDPQAAFDVMKHSAEAGMALFARNLQAASTLSMDQFSSGVQAMEKGAAGVATAATAKKAR